MSTARTIKTIHFMKNTKQSADLTEREIILTSTESNIKITQSMIEDDDDTIRTVLVSLPEGEVSMQDSELGCELVATGRFKNSADDFLINGISIDSCVASLFNTLLENKISKDTMPVAVAALSSELDIVTAMRAAGHTVEPSYDSYSEESSSENSTSEDSSSEDSESSEDEASDSEDTSKPQLTKNGIVSLYLFAALIIAAAIGVAMIGLPSMIIMGIGVSMIGVAIALVATKDLIRLIRQPNVSESENTPVESSQPDSSTTAELQKRNPELLSSSSTVAPPLGEPESKPLESVAGFFSTLFACSRAGASLNTEESSPPSPPRIDL